MNYSLQVIVFKNVFVTTYKKFTHSSTLARRTPWTEALGGLQSVGVTESWTGPGTHACNCTNTQVLCKMGAGVGTEAPVSSRLVALFTIT